MTPPAEWICRGRRVRTDGPPLVMGVLNVTPDSFSDGGRYLDPDAAVEHALRMAADGAEIIDCGAESTRPGAREVPADEQIRRALPVLRSLARATDALISIDTRSAVVAREALGAGAHIVNDVSALRHDPAMAATAAEFEAGVVLMHMRGTPETMQRETGYTDVAGEVCAHLERRVHAAREAGIAETRIAVDPGIGFGKTAEQNVTLLRALPRLVESGRPVLVGASRKSFIGRLLDRPAGERMAGGLAVALHAAARGARIIRTHDVRETCDALRIWATLAREGKE
ncbi:dihydropteroate synthase [Kiritimatiella glycovorans]|uniref:Dihydropteroate synthase n=1 Tax=Kiritimatiella glycovorans TaxID=1307763 RepID=A0A0G3EKS5_9BACT|nr:dihydropteroate synthase [Kiritimatiella glycovorans]AKJ65355.1 Dihydropteroate synthase [Kiritimatiella glycovorans]